MLYRLLLGLEMSFFKKKEFVNLSFFAFQVLLISSMVVVKALNITTGS